MKWYKLLMTALLAITVSGAVALADSGGVTASFTTDVSSGQAPLTVQFTDTSTGSPIGWSWDFGDGSPAVNDQNPSHTFEASGTYEVTLTVSDGTNSATTTGEITVSDAATPTPAPAGAGTLAAAFASDVNGGAAPLTVQFTDTSAGSPTGWSWDFGDGSPAVTDENPSYTFQTPGTYTVTLTVTDGNQTSTAMNAINVEAAATAAPTDEGPTMSPVDVTAAPTTETATPSPALPAGVTALTLIATAGLALALGRAEKK